MSLAQSSLLYPSSFGAETLPSSCLCSYPHLDSKLNPGFLLSPSQVHPLLSISASTISAQLGDHISLLVGLPVIPWPLQSILHTTTVLISLKHTLDHVISLLKTSQWFLVHLELSPRSLGSPRPGPGALPLVILLPLSHCFISQLSAPATLDLRRLPPAMPGPQNRASLFAVQMGRRSPWGCWDLPKNEHNTDESRAEL